MVSGDADQRGKDVTESIRAKPKTTHIGMMEAGEKHIPTAEKAGRADAADAWDAERLAMQSKIGVCIAPWRFTNMGRRA